jgi:uncharacterized protein
MRTVRRTVPAPADIGTEVIGVPPDSDLELNLRFEAVMEGVLVSGTARGRLAGECVRCLGDVEQELAVDLQDLFAYPDHAVDVDEEDDVREIEDELIDLEPALRDAVVLALPFKPMCRDDCPGLCSECGARLADDPGHHHGEAVDQRWTALQSLVIDEKES